MTLTIDAAGLDDDALATIRAAVQTARWEAGVRACYRRHLRRHPKQIAREKAAEEMGTSPAKVRRLTYGS